MRNRRHWIVALLAAPLLGPVAHADERADWDEPHRSAELTAWRDRYVDPFRGLTTRGRAATGLAVDDPGFAPLPAGFAAVIADVELERPLWLRHAEGQATEAREMRRGKAALAKARHRTGRRPLPGSRAARPAR